MLERDLVFLTNLGIVACLAMFGLIASHFLDRDLDQLDAELEDDA